MISPEYDYFIEESSPTWTTIKNVLEICALAVNTLALGYITYMVSSIALSALFRPLPLVGRAFIHIKFVEFHKAWVGLCIYLTIHTISGMLAFFTCLGLISYVRPAPSCNCEYGHRLPFPPPPTQIANSALLIQQDSDEVDLLINLLSHIPSETLPKLNASNYHRTLQHHTFFGRSLSDLETFKAKFKIATSSLFDTNVLNKLIGEFLQENEEASLDDLECACGDSYSDFCTFVVRSIIAKPPKHPVRFLQGITDEDPRPIEFKRLSTKTSGADVKNFASHYLYQGNPMFNSAFSRAIKFYINNEERLS